VDLNQLESGEGGVDGLDQGALARASRAPKKGIIAGQALGKSLRIGLEAVAVPINAFQQAQGPPD
jgi:hypothetical protein